jgi:hypothetical protein
MMQFAELESIDGAGIVAYLRSTGWRESGPYARSAKGVTDKASTWRYTVAWKCSKLS